MNYAMLLKTLVEAEGRRDDESLPFGVRVRSAETAAICNEKLAMAGMTREQLVAAARQNRSKSHA